MNKNDIIDQIAATLGDRHQAKAAVDSMLPHITGALRKGESVTLSGFGSFKRVQRQARAKASIRVLARASRSWPASWHVSPQVRACRKP